MLSSTLVAQSSRTEDSRMLNSRISSTGTQATTLQDTLQNVNIAVRVSFVLVGMLVALAGLWSARLGIIG